MLKSTVEISVKDKGVMLSYGNTAIEIDGIDSKKELDNYIERNIHLNKVLSENGMIKPSSDSEKLLEKNGIDAMEFYQKHKEYGLSLLRKIYEHPIWDALIDPNCPKSLILGFTLEKYHYIEGAHEHMAFAAANADSTMMPHLATHFIEEYTHGDIYKHGLKGFYSAEQVETSISLPTTRALVNGLSEFAMDDSFCYYAANELLQLTENVDSKDEGEVGEFYQLLLDNHPWTAEIVKSYRAHTTLDQNLGHEGAFMEMCKSVGTISYDKANKAIHNTKKIAEYLYTFLDGIYEYYGDCATALRTHAVAKVKLGN